MELGQRNDETGVRLYSSGTPHGGTDTKIGSTWPRGWITLNASDGASWPEPSQTAPVERFIAPAACQCQHGAWATAQRAAASNLRCVPH